MPEQGCPTCGYVAIRESQEMLDDMVVEQEISACPACGSVFVLHRCHADPASTGRTEHTHS